MRESGEEQGILPKIFTPDTNNSIKKCSKLKKKFSTEGF